MSTEEIISGNKLIAEFMEWQLSGCFYRYYSQFQRYLYNPQTGNDKSHHQEQLSFHTSWDWLMPVVEKLCKHKYEVDYDEHSDTSYMRTFGMPSENGKLMVRINRGSLLKLTHL